VQASLGSLQKRRRMLDDAWFHARGYPIGSGTVASANTLVVEARLKRAGMHWARAHVNPLVALRTIAGNDRWADAWPQLAQAERRRLWPQRVQRQERRQAKRPPAALHMASASEPVAQPAALWPVTAPMRPTASLFLALSSPKVPYRPPPAHPWRRFRIGRVRAQPPAATCVAKL
jgi:hypothetical protein